MTFYEKSDSARWGKMHKIRIDHIDTGYAIVGNGFCWFKSDRGFYDFESTGTIDEQRRELFMEVRRRRAVRAEIEERRREADRKAAGTRDVNHEHTNSARVNMPTWTGD